MTMLGSEEKGKIYTGTTNIHSKLRKTESPDVVNTVLTSDRLGGGWPGLAVL